MRCATGDEEGEEEGHHHPLNSSDFLQKRERAMVITGVRDKRDELKVEALGGCPVLACLMQFSLLSHLYSGTENLRGPS